MYTAKSLLSIKDQGLGRSHTGLSKAASGAARGQLVLTRILPWRSRRTARASRSEVFALHECPPPFQFLSVFIGS
jgi:hypothetical protein